MPLDMQETRLADIASWLGITPVPNAVLEAHKVAEVAKHPGSWCYRHSTLAGAAFRLGSMLVILGITLGSVLAIVTMFLSLYTTALFALGGVVVLAYVFSRIIATDILSMQGARFYGPAEWMEYAMPLQDIPTAPGSIKALAAKIISAVPDAEVVYGWLVQNFVTIDPYLVIRRGTDQIVVGIWDDHGIIQQASPDR